MNEKLIISPKRKITPTIYAYTTPTNTDKIGWVKIGYTDRDADIRIKEQTHTAGIQPKKLWNYEARFNGGGYFVDYDFHTFLKKNGIRREKGTEWFYFNGNTERAKELYREFIFKDYSSLQLGKEVEYRLRKEQEAAVDKTLAYAKNNKGGEFLWNAKPRFGKTLTAYDLVRKLDVKNVLIVTNRPAIADSWYEDFEKFIAWQTNYKFVSESDSLKDKPVMTRNEYIDFLCEKEDASQIAFLSLQDMKGSKYFGGIYDKLQWVTAVPWDLLIIDEAHEGVDTLKTDVAFEQIKRSFTLHLSGTPFKAIAKGSFSDKQIFNWSYEDEQEAKVNWNQEENNPYNLLPRLNLFTYQMSKMITDEINTGAQLEGEDIDYSFDLNEFFSTKENGKFEYETDIKKWLDTLTHNKKYPFSTPELRKELKHTFWLLNRVSSAQALAEILKKHPVFESYKIILAAGNGKTEEDIDANENSLQRVRNEIKLNDKTITLSVGQLTTGVTIPEWTAVMMLSNIKSPALYMQAAFRAQNPHVWTSSVDGKENRFQKDNAYVFDFAPERTLIIFDEFANNLSIQTTSGGGTSLDRETNIKRLLNFFPVIGEDKDGEMVELDASQVLTIPKFIKASEVVKRGFMSNLLFANISGIFQAPQVALDILGKLKHESQGRVNQRNSEINTKDIQVDENEEVLVEEDIIVNQTDAIFGDKLYAYENLVKSDESQDIDKSSSNQVAKNIGKQVLESMTSDLQKVKNEYNITIAGSKRIEQKIQDEVVKTVNKLRTDFIIQKSQAEKVFEETIHSAETEQQREKIKSEYDSTTKETFETYNSNIDNKISETVQDIQKQIIHEQERKIKNKEKNSIEEDVRSRLRGFARTIPSFIMAYGDEKLSLENFDVYTPEEVFIEVTGITLDQFKFLRDGGEYQDGGETLYFMGKLFDEIVFNESVQEFLRKKNELSNYFEVNEEDIFDYIPSQKTNQIFTPKNVVNLMVDKLEEENPGIYDNSSKTFIDLYMKSGLYITEIVKRIYNSPSVKKEFPDEGKRIKHILENQVYGFAPSEIIFNIATNFIFGNSNEDIERSNFIKEDTTPYTKNGELQKLIDSNFKKTL